jgi:hypothetical protein
MKKTSNKANLDSRHDLSNDFVQALAADWKEHGSSTIEAVREKTPDRYCELIAKVVPKEMLVSSDRSSKVDYSGLDPEEIGKKLLVDIGMPELAITAGALEQSEAAYNAFLDRLQSIAQGN